MNQTPQNRSDLVDALASATATEIDDAVGKILHCVRQLSDDQLWWRPTDTMNSIANLILHVCGNLRQWVIAGAGGAEDTRNRPQEFAQRERIARADLVQMLQDVAKEARRAIFSVDAQEMVRVRSIQGFEVTGAQAIIESVAHFRGHTQEIIHITRLQLQDAYEFDFVPSAEQQGAAASSD